MTAMRDPAELLAAILELQSGDGSPRRQLTWRVGNVLREVIERLVSTQASDSDLEQMLDQLESIVEVLRGFPHGRRYEGVSEASTGPPPSMPGETADHNDFSPVVGKANPLAPPLILGARDDVVTGTVICGSAYEGPPGHIHGGVTAALFDELLGATQVLSGNPGMTGQLEVSYRAPAPLHVPLHLEGRLVNVEGRKIRTEGTLRAGDTLCATATGLFITVDFEKLARMVAKRDRLGRSDQSPQVAD